MKATVILDLSRLLLGSPRCGPTGIDRVEMAYAAYLMQHEPDRLEFAAIHPLGHLALLPRELSRRFIRGLAQHWETPCRGASRLVFDAHRLLHGTLLRRSVAARLADHAGGARHSAAGRPIYLNVSHHHLSRPRAIEAVRRQGARFVCLVHDLIPIELPEYVRPKAAATHRRRIDTVARLSDGIIVNSAATRDALTPYLDQAGRAPPVVVAQLGVPGSAAAAGMNPAHPYFVCLGTIEPRKNHLLLLNIWRRLASELGDAAPRLILVGRRGWENENILDMIDRCSVPSGLVEERRGLSDSEVGRLLGGARALLFPSFAEGYGLPLAEALAIGVPVLCSDLPVLRELGGDVPEYLDPLDGIGWMRAIRDYTESDPARRGAQLDRLVAWRAPSWNRHVRSALDLIDSGLSAA